MQSTDLQLVFTIGRVGVEDAEQLCDAARSQQADVLGLVVLNERLH